MKHKILSTSTPEHFPIHIAPTNWVKMHLVNPVKTRHSVPIQAKFYDNNFSQSENKRIQSAVSRARENFRQNRPFPYQKGPNKEQLGAKWLEDFASISKQTREETKRQILAENANVSREKPVSPYGSENGGQNKGSASKNGATPNADKNPSSAATTRLVTPGAPPNIDIFRMIASAHPLLRKAFFSDTGHFNQAPFEKYFTVYSLRKGGPYLLEKSWKVQHQLRLWIADTGIKSSEVISDSLWNPQQKLSEKHRGKIVKIISQMPDRIVIDKSGNIIFMGMTPSPKQEPRLDATIYSDVIGQDVGISWENNEFIIMGLKLPDTHLHSGFKTDHQQACIIQEILEHIPRLAHSVKQIVEDKKTLWFRLSFPSIQENSKKPLVRVLVRGCCSNVINDEINSGSDNIVEELEQKINALETGVTNIPSLGLDIQVMPPARLYKPTPSLKELKDIPKPPKTPSLPPTDNDKSLKLMPGLVKIASGHRVVSEFSSYIQIRMAQLLVLSFKYFLEQYGLSRLDNIKELSSFETVDAFKTAVASDLKTYISSANQKRLEVYDQVFGAKDTDSLPKSETEDVQEPIDRIIDDFVALYIKLCEAPQNFPQFMHHSRTKFDVLAMLIKIHNDMNKTHTGEFQTTCQEFMKARQTFSQVGFRGATLPTFKEFLANLSDMADGIYAIKDGQTFESYASNGRLVVEAITQALDKNVFSHVSASPSAEVDTELESVRQSVLKEDDPFIEIAIEQTFGWGNIKKLISCIKNDASFFRQPFFHPPYLGRFNLIAAVHIIRTDLSTPLATSHKPSRSEKRSARTRRKIQALRNQVYSHSKNWDSVVQPYTSTIDRLRKKSQAVRRHHGRLNNQTQIGTGVQSFNSQSYVIPEVAEILREWGVPDFYANPECVKVISIGAPIYVLQDPGSSGGLSPYIYIQRELVEVAARHRHMLGQIILKDDVKKHKMAARVRECKRQDQKVVVISDKAMNDFNSKNRMSSTLSFVTATQYQFYQNILTGMADYPDKRQIHNILKACTVYNASMYDRINALVSKPMSAPDKDRIIMDIIRNLQEGHQTSLKTKFMGVQPHHWNCLANMVYEAYVFAIHFSRVTIAPFFSNDSSSNAERLFIVGMSNATYLFELEAKLGHRSFMPYMCHADLFFSSRLNKPFTFGFKSFSNYAQIFERLGFFEPCYSRC